jgi:hypothetical protein
MLKRDYPQDQIDRWNANRRLKRKNDPVHRAATIAASKVWYKANREAQLRYVFLKKYGITWEERDALLAAQGGCCKLCRSPDHAAGDKGWHTDHDPTKQKGEPGFIRGILCSNCNTGLGKFKHNTKLMDRATVYLETGGARIQNRSNGWDAPRLGCKVATAGTSDFLL